VTSLLARNHVRGTKKRGRKKSKRAREEEARWHVFKDMGLTRKKETKVNILDGKKLHSQEKEKDGGGYCK